MLKVKSSSDFCKCDKMRLTLGSHAEKCDPSLCAGCIEDANWLGSAGTLFITAPLPSEPASSGAGTSIYVVIGAFTAFTPFAVPLPSSLSFNACFEGGLKDALGLYKCLSLTTSVGTGTPSAAYSSDRKINFVRLSSAMSWPCSKSILTRRPEDLVKNKI